MQRRATTLAPSRKRARNSGDDRAAKPKTRAVTRTSAAAAAANAAAATRIQRWLRQRRFRVRMNAVEPVSLEPVHTIQRPFVLVDGDGSGRFCVFETELLARTIIETGHVVNPLTRLPLNRVEVARLHNAYAAAHPGANLRHSIAAGVLRAAAERDRLATVMYLEHCAAKAAEKLMLLADRATRYSRSRLVYSGLGDGIASVHLKLARPGDAGVARVLDDATARRALRYAVHKYGNAALSLFDEAPDDYAALIEALRRRWLHIRGALHAPRPDVALYVDGVFQTSPVAS
jgi:hypothetical protein